MRFDRLLKKTKPTSLYLNSHKSPDFWNIMLASGLSLPTAAKAIFEFGSDLVTRLQPKKWGGGWGREREEIVRKKSCEFQKQKVSIFQAAFTRGFGS